MEKRYQIFISSTYLDLIEERNKVIKAILSLYHFPIGMEMFHADNEEQWVQIKNTILMSDYYILIVGRNYGTMIKKEHISYTEKEYDFAISNGIPVLAFIISDRAKKESYGNETATQQKLLKKFKEKVKELPCQFWENADQLALQVATTLSLKFKENNRCGWTQDLQIINKKINKNLSGIYNVIYFSAFNHQTKRIIKSKLCIDELGNAKFYNNIKNKTDYEYTYSGFCCEESNIIYILLKNDNSYERCFLSIIKSVGDMNRYLGILTATSSSGVPVSVKISLFKNDMHNSIINMAAIEKILLSQNKLFDESCFIIEDSDKFLFFSDAILNCK